MQSELPPRPHDFGDKRVRVEQKKADRMKPFPVDTVWKCFKASINTLYANLYAVKRILNSYVNPT